jgi:hypothetical protein
MPAALEQEDGMPLTAIRDAQVGDRHRMLIAVLLSLFTFAVCYLRSFILPRVPILSGGDALGFLVAGSRIVGGELPYRDFFEVVPVGADLTYAVVIKGFACAPGFRVW